MTAEVPATAPTLQRADAPATTYAALNFSFRVDCPDPAISSVLDRALAPLTDRSPAEHTYRIAVGGGPCEIAFDDELVATTRSRGHAIAWLIWHVNQRAASASSEHLLLHAGAVQLGTSGVVVPAPMNAGKTTLIAGLVRRGLDYLTDELVALRMADRVLLPYPKALTVEPGSFAVLGLHAPDGTEQLLVPSDELRASSVGSPCPLAVLIAPCYRPDEATTLSRLSTYETFMELATNTVNMDQHGASAVSLLTEVAARCVGYRLVMSDLDRACQLVLDALGGP